MNEHREAEHFRRIKIISRIERSEEILKLYDDGIAWQHELIRKDCVRLGHIAAALGEREPEDGPQ